MKFRGKIGIWWYAVLAVLAYASIVEFLPVPKGDSYQAAPLWLNIIIILLVIVLIDATIRNYIWLDEEALTVRMGLIRYKVRYKNIVSLKKTHNPLASMAMSLDRISIRERGSETFVAVIEKEAFINELIRRNPDIKRLN